MDWSNEASLALIHEYRNQPVLWNNKHNHYYSKKKKQEAWETVAYSLEMEVEDVRQKMNSLLGSFRRERSKVRRGSGKHGTRIYYSRWFAFSSMQFLLDRKEESSNDKVYLEELQVKMEEDDYDELALDSDSNHLLEEELSEAVPENPKRPEKAPHALAPPAKRGKIKYHPSTPQDNLASFRVEDECSTYANYVSSKLQKFSDVTRAHVELAISKILFQADMGKFQELPSTCDARREVPETDPISPLNGISDPSFTVGQSSQSVDEAQGTDGT